MKVEERKLTELKPYENNPRHNDNAVDAVANSIKVSYNNSVKVRSSRNVIKLYTWLLSDKIGRTLILS